MAESWKSGDSARKMTEKYNTAANEINDLKKSSVEINEKTQDELNKKVEKVITQISVSGTTLIIGK